MIPERLFSHLVPDHDNRTMLADGLTRKYGRGIAAWLLVSLTAVMARPVPAQDEECIPSMMFGWYLCTGPSYAAAVPHEIALNSSVPKDQSYPFFICKDPPWWKLWGRPTLKFVIMSGDTTVPYDDVTVSVKFVRGTTLRTYSASTEIVDGEYSMITVTDGAQEIAKTAQSYQSMTWRVQDEEGVHINDRIGTITLGIPLLGVLAACSERGGS